MPPSPPTDDERVTADELASELGLHVQSISYRVAAINKRSGPDDQIVGSRVPGRCGYTARDAMRIRNYTRKGATTAADAAPRTRKPGT